MNGNRRQYVLLGLLVLVVLVYLRFSGSAPVADDIGSLPPVDVAGLAQSLQNVNTVGKGLIAFRADSEPDRNLFQYGVKLPPPPDPAELERQRLAAEEALMRQEERAREVKRQQEMQMQREAAAAAAAPVAPPPPRKDPGPQRPVVPPPPTVDFKFMGIVGTAERRVGVFVNGESLMLARKGGVLEEKFRILDIGVAWADIGYVDPIHKDQSKRLYFGH